jgi:hypothetical protein
MPGNHRVPGPQSQVWRGLRPLNALPQAGIFHKAERDQEDGIVDCQQEQCYTSVGQQWIGTGPGICNGLHAGLSEAYVNLLLASLCQSGYGFNVRAL